MTKRAQLNGSRIVVRDADYDEQRALPVRVHSCVGHARLGKAGTINVLIEDEIHRDGRIYFCLDIETPGPDGGEVSLFGLTLQELLTISATLEQTIARARERRIVRP